MDMGAEQADQRKRDPLSRPKDTLDTSSLESLDANASRFGFTRDTEGTIRSRGGLLTNGWVLLRDPALADTGALGPCCGIIIHDERNSLTMIGHFSDPLDSRDRETSIEGMMEAASNRLLLSEARIMIGGIQRHTDFEAEGLPWNADELRASVLSKVLEFGVDPAQTSTHFSESKNGCSLQYDTRRKSLTVEEF